jgi:2-polyprenyl-3-methyl-5-hydroxy-6-metoxy-1,4-benzoquinol methylase
LKSKLAELPTNPDVLEIGAGFGKWAEALKGLYASFTGVDVTLARIEHAKKIRGGPNVSFHHIPTPDWNLGRKFPVVLSITVIQHLLMPQAIDVLKGIERHLAPGGTAILAEGRIYDITLAEAEARYRDSANAAHMIPKPLALLKEAVPELRWYQESGGKFLLTRN